MAGFSLGGGGGGGGEGNNHHHHHQNPSQESLYLYRNEEISSYNHHHSNQNKGFEIWQQHLQRHHYHQNAAAAAAPYLEVGSGPTRSNTNISDESSSRALTMMMRGVHQGGSGSGSGSGGDQGGSGKSCQDCGNQAKKDCVHSRCRTCCKSRGFPCQTHVKSTWVPASRRRERQQQLAAIQEQQQQQQQLQLRSSGGGENTKRPRGDCTTRIPSSGLVLGNFPPELNSPAVFRCVKVSGIDDAEEQYAYQTAVNIAGHVFKGILYDNGPEGHYVHGESSSGGGGVARNLITDATHTTTATTATTTTSPAVVSAAALLDASSLYPTPLNAFMAGTHFFPPPRS